MYRWQDASSIEKNTYSMEKNVEFVFQKTRKNFPEDYLHNIIWADMQNGMPAHVHVWQAGDL